MDISSGVIKHGKLVSLGDGNMFTEVESHLHIVTLKVDDTQWVGASHWDRKPGAQQFWEPRERHVELAMCLNLAGLQPR